MIAEWVVHRVLDREVSGLNTGGVKLFSTSLSFESSSSVISRLIYFQTSLKVESWRSNNFSVYQKEFFFTCVNLTSVLTVSSPECY